MDNQEENQSKNQTVNATNDQSENEMASSSDKAPSMEEFQFDNTTNETTTNNDTNTNTTTIDSTANNKKSTKKTSTRSKTIKVLLVSVAAILLVICISAYLFVHSYINKMNLVTSAETNNQLTEQEVEIEPEPEDLNSTEPDSPEEEIVSVEDQIRNNMEENSTPILKDKDVYNILLIGGDSRQVGGNARSDAMIIVSINKKTKSIIATSVLRDIYLSIPGKSNNRINAAFAYGGADLLLDTIEQNFKIHIDRYVSIDFFAFMDVIDATGGVTLDVTDKEIPIINNYIHELNGLLGEDAEKDVITSPGTLLLNGKQALGYARNRYIGTDFERTARQRRVLEQVFLNIKSLGLTELNDLLNTILPQVTTNLKEGEIFSLILGLPKYASYNLEQWSIPVNGSYSFMRIRGMAVIGVDFEENINEIHKRIYGYSN
ncbi:MAG: hypothetical protein K0S41_3722 [Anaerocolumna sp.]|jgi:LCP family protein required for cell wall assembly|nr:hypothetical protein [Anaerocolumna sp.]